jgi:hypothetical protein
MAFMLRALDRLRQQPFIESAGGIDVLPIGGVLPERPALRTPGLKAEELGAVWSVTPSYLDTIQPHLLAGRLLGRSDADGASAGCVVTRSAAGKFVALGADPLGSPVDLGDRSCHIVGVVDDLLNGFGGKTTWGVFAPFQGQPGRRMTIVARYHSLAALNVSGLAALFREEGRPVAIQVEQVEKRMYGSVAALRLQAVYFQVISVVAFLLAVVGSVALMMTALDGRRHRHVIQLALGGGQGSILRDVTRGLLWPAVAGGAIGVVGGLGLQSLLRSQVVGFQPVSALLFVVVGVAFICFKVIVAATCLQRTKRYHLADELKTLS